MRGRSWLAGCVPFLLVMTGCGHDEIMSAEDHSAAKERFVFEGHLDPELADRELRARMSFVARDKARFICQFYSVGLGDFVPKRVRQIRGEYSIDGAGDYRLVVPLDPPASPDCDWELVTTTVGLWSFNEGFHPLDQLQDIAVFVEGVSGRLRDDSNVASCYTGARDRLRCPRLPGVLGKRGLYDSDSPRRLDVVVVDDSDSNAPAPSQAP